MRSTNMRADQLRQVIMKKTRMLAQQNIAVTQRGTGAYCKFNKRTGKPELINLPVIPPEPSEGFLAALEGYIDHEVAHALETTHSDWKGVDDLVEGVPNGIRAQVVNVVEDVRIENVMPIRFPGSISNLQAVRQFMVDQLWGPQLDLMGDIFDPRVAGKARTAALVPFLRAMGGHQACVQFVEDRGLMELYKPLLDQIPDLAERFKALKSTKDAAILAEDLIRAIKKPKKKKKKAPPPPPPPPVEEPPEPEVPDLEDLMDEPPPPEQEPEKSDEQALGEADDGTADEQQEEPSDEGEEKPDEAASDADASDEPAEEEGEGDDEGEADDAGASDQEGDDEDEGAASGSDKEDDDNSGTDPEGEDDKNPLSSGGDGKVNISLKEAMEQLTPTQRKALLLYNGKRKTIEEIAEETTRTPGQVTRTLRDARRRLSVIMEGNSK